MKKIETIWHYLLQSALNRKVFKHTQQELAKMFSISLSTVHHALRVPSDIGAVRKESKFFVLTDPIKLLYFWGSVRNLSRRIIYSTYSEGSVTTREGMILPTSVYAGYSAGRRMLGEAPADYDAVYVYDDKVNLIQMRLRFPEVLGHKPNLIVLEATPEIKKMKTYTSLPLTFVDIWNLPDWYAKDFITALERRINEFLS